MEKMAYRVEEFAEAHGLGRPTVYEEIRAGRLKVAKVGRRTVITTEAARDWRARLSAEAGEVRAA
jgi:excisionase family DNA binding protein